MRYERDQGLYLHSGGVLPLGRIRAAGQSVLRRGADSRRVPVRTFMGDSGKRGKAVRPALSGTAPRSRQDKHLTDSLRIGIGSIRKKEVNAMNCDEALYRQYLSGDDEGLNALMKKYGDHRDLHSFPTRRSSDLVRAFMGDPGKRGKAVRPALSGTAPRSRQDKHLTEPPLHLKHPQNGSERYDQIGRAHV